MKTKTFFLLCLLLGIATVQLSAQGWSTSPDNKNVTGTLTYNTVWTMDQSNPFYFWPDAPNALTSLTGSMDVHVQYFFQNGIHEYAKYSVHGEVTSNISGEVFKISEIGTDYDNSGYSMLNFNFIGNQGSHYLITAKTVWGGPLTIDKYLFLENGK
jgi:hypothetical protein